MRNVEKKVKEQDSLIKKRAHELKQAIDKTCSVDGFEAKFEVKVIRHLNKEHGKRFSSAGMRNLDDTQAIFSDMQYATRETMMEMNAKKKQKPVPEQNILDSMNISAIENVYNEQDTLFGDGLNISKINQGGWNSGGGPVVGKSNLN